MLDPVDAAMRRDRQQSTTIEGMKRIENGYRSPIAGIMVGRIEPGKYSTQQVHLLDEKFSGVERGAAWWLQNTRKIGAKAHHWAAAMLQQRGIAGVRVLMGLQRLADKHPWRTVNEACEIANSYGEYRLATVRKLIDRRAPKQQEFDFAAEHDVIRPLSDYAEFVKSCLRKENAS